MGILCARHVSMPARSFPRPQLVSWGNETSPEAAEVVSRSTFFVAAYRVGVALPRRMHAGLVPSCSLYQPSTPVLGLCEVACTSNYVMLSIPCLDASATPLADIASRVKYAVTSMWAEDGTSGSPMPSKSLSTWSPMTARSHPSRSVLYVESKSRSLSLSLVSLSLALSLWLLLALFWDVLARPSRMESSDGLQLVNRPMMLGSNAA